MRWALCLPTAKDCRNNDQLLGCYHTWPVERLNILVSILEFIECNSKGGPLKTVL